MRKTPLAVMPCPVARSLDEIGEWWSLILIRDAFRGARRYEDFKGIGIADNMLSARLRKLVESGVFERRRYQEHPERFEYLLTEKGRDLLTVLAALGMWGKKWTNGNDTTSLTHKACGGRVTLNAYCPDCGRPIESHEIRIPRLIGQSPQDTPGQPVAGVVASGAPA